MLTTLIIILFIINLAILLIFLKTKNSKVEYYSFVTGVIICIILFVLCQINMYILLNK
jgi:uncharacterized membrane protein